MGTPAALISVSPSGGNYRDLAAPLMRNMTPTVREITLDVIKGAAECRLARVLSHAFVYRCK